MPFSKLFTKVPKSLSLKSKTGEKTHLQANSLAAKTKESNIFSLGKLGNDKSENLNKKSFSLNTESFTRPKFEKFISKTPFLLLKLKDLNYSKFGYFASMVMDSQEKSQFVSVLPLKYDSHLPLNQQNLYFTNQNKENLHSFYKTINISENLNPLNLYGLKNSYQWSSKSRNSFFWIPEFSKNKVAGLFCFQNLSLLQKTLYEKLTKLNLKSSKQRSLNSLKHLNLLNMNHSQLSKKVRKETTVTKVDKKHFSKMIVNQKNTNVSRHLTNLTFQKKNLHSTFLLGFNEKQKKYAKFKFKKHIFSEKNPNGVNKLIDFKKSFLNKKQNNHFKASKHLSIEFNLDQKNAIDYNELSWIPEENYHFECFGNQLSFFKENLHQSFFVSKNRHTELKLTKLNCYQSNAQGFKKHFKFETEGFLKVQKITQNRPKGLNALASDFFIPFKQSQSNVKNHSDPQQNEVKNHFLKYLKSRKFLSKKHNKQENLNQYGLIAKPENADSFFTSIPYLQKPSLRVNLVAIQKKKNLTIVENLNQMKKKLNSIRLTLKPGWVYKTENIENLFISHKTLINQGNILLDDLSFDQHKIMMEIISISEKNIVFKSSRFKKNSSFVTISHLIQNKKARFFTKQMTQACETGASKSFGLLLRPSYHRIFPTATDMKLQLYSSMQKNRLKNFENSYFHYKQYFLSNLNFQIPPLKMISQFSSHDLEIDSVESFSKSFETKSLKKDSPLKKFSKVSLKTLNSKKYLKEKKWKMLKASSLFLFPEQKQSKNHLNQKLQRHNPFPLEGSHSGFRPDRTKTLRSFYFSNFPRAFPSYQISLEKSSENSSELSVSKIQFKSTQLQNFLLD